MALFEAGIVQTAAPGTVSTLIWNPSNTSATTFGSLGSVPAASVFHDLTIINQGTCNLYINSGSVSATQGTSGVLLTVNSVMTIQGYSGTVGTAGTIWANTGTVGLTGATTVGMPSVASVI
jgi:hypothetical protein